MEHGHNTQHVGLTEGLEAVKCSKLVRTEGPRRTSLSASEASHCFVVPGNSTAVNEKMWSFGDEELGTVTF